MTARAPLVFGSDGVPQQLQAGDTLSGVISTASPAMNGAAATGSTGKASDAGHVHPSDTSRLASANNLSDLASTSTARSNLGAAASGANSDITSLTGLSNIAGPVAIGGQVTVTGGPSSGFRLLNGSSTLTIFNDGNSHIESNDQIWINGNSTAGTAIAYGGGPLVIGAPNVTAQMRGSLSVAGQVVTGSGYYANDRSGSGHSSVFYRNNDTTRLWDYAYGDTIVYDTAGNVTLPGKLSIGTPLAAASGGTGAASASAGQVFAGPVSGAAAAPGFRAIAFGDLPAGIGSSPINLSLSAAVASNALTVSVLGANGAAPSASNPVYIPFKASGGLTWLAVTSPLSLTVPSGATLGTRNGAAARIWIVAINNGGAPLLGVQVCTDGATAIYTLGQSYPRTSVTISSSSGTAGTLYAASAVTGPITVLGCVEATEATAGTWATAPSVVRRWMPGDKLPGDVEQIVTASNATSNNSNLGTYNTSGQVQGVAAVITPASPINAIRTRVSGGNFVNPGTNELVSLRITRGSTNLTLAEWSDYFFANGGAWGTNSATQYTPSVEAPLDFPATASPLTYLTQVKNGGTSSNIVYPNGGTARISIEEIVT